MNILFTKIFFLAFIDIFLTTIDFVDAYEIGYFEEWFDEIDDDEYNCNATQIGYDNGDSMIKCPYCKNKNKDLISQQDRNLLGISDYGRIFTCLECKNVFYVSLTHASSNEIYNYKR